MRWADVNHIAIEPEQADVNVLQLRFTALHKWICALERFDDEPNKSSARQSSARPLEAIQMAWIDKRED